MLNACTASDLANFWVVQSSEKLRCNDYKFHLKVHKICITYRQVTTCYETLAAHIHIRAHSLKLIVSVLSFIVEHNKYCHTVTCMRPSPVLKQGSLTKSVSFRVNWCHNLSIKTVSVTSSSEFCHYKTTSWQ